MGAFRYIAKLINTVEKNPAGQILVDVGGGVIAGMSAPAVAVGAAVTAVDYAIKHSIKGSKSRVITSGIDTASDIATKSSPFNITEDVADLVYNIYRTIKKIKNQKSTPNPPTPKETHKEKFNNIMKNLPSYASNKKTGILLLNNDLNTSQSFYYDFKKKKFVIMKDNKKEYFNSWDDIKDEYKNNILNKVDEKQLNKVIFQLKEFPNLSKSNSTKEKRNNFLSPQPLENNPFVPATSPKPPRPYE